MNKMINNSTETELEQALIRLAQQSYIALMNADIDQASDWYELVQDALRILGPGRAEREMKVIMGEYLNRTRKFNSEMSEKIRNNQAQ